MKIASLVLRASWVNVKPKNARFSRAVVKIFLDGLPLAVGVVSACASEEDAVKEFQRRPTHFKPLGKWTVAQLATYAKVAA